MSGHHPFQRLVENLPEERKLAIDQKKKAMLAEIELREAIFQRKGYANESSIANWHLDPSTTSIEQVDACLNYLRQAVRDLGGELAITAKFPDMRELSILPGRGFANESVKIMTD
jgi:hypothetical protein